MSMQSLERFSTTEQKKILDCLSHTGCLAQFVGADFDMLVKLGEPGSGSFWNFDTNEVALDPLDLLELPPGGVRALAVHEGTHRRILDPKCLPKDLLALPGYLFMTNAVEDCRGNNFALAHFPEFSRDFVELYSRHLEADAQFTLETQQKLGFKPRYIQTGLEYIRDWCCNERSEAYEVPTILSAEVKLCLEKTLPACRRSSLHFPSLQECEVDKAAINFYCSASTEINIKEIWPEFKKLIELDSNDAALQSMLQDYFGSSPSAWSAQESQALKRALTAGQHQELDAAVRKAQSHTLQDRRQEIVIPLGELSPDLLDKLSRHKEALPKQEQNHYFSQGQRTLLTVESKLIDLELNLNTTSEATQADRPYKLQEALLEERLLSQEPTAEARNNLVQEHEAEASEDAQSDEKKAFSQDRYEHYRCELQPYIRRLSSSLDSVLSANAQSDFETGFRSGTNFSMTRRIREIGQGTDVSGSRAFSRKIEQSVRNYAFFLLIDLSESMSGEKVMQAAKAAVLLSEALQANFVPFGIAGFNTEYHSLKSLADSICPATRSRIGGVETLVGGGTRTGWAADIALKELMEADAQQRILIVLTDGQECTDTDDKGTLQVMQKMRRVYTNEAPIVIGLGLGPNTEMVATYFPNHLTNLDVATLPKRLTVLVEKLLCQGDCFS